MSPRPRFLKLDKNRRESILEAAGEEFSKFGFENASLNQIIKRAGISKGATYYYFDDKQDLFMTVVDHLMQVFNKEDVIEALGESGDFWGDIEAYAVNSFKLMRKIPYAKGMMRAVLEFTRRHEGSIVFEKTMEIGRNLSVKFIERGQRLGEVRDDLPTELLVELMIAVDLVLDRWTLENQALDSDEEIEAWSANLVDLFRRILEKREDI